MINTNAFDINNLKVNIKVQKTDIIDVFYQYNEKSQTRPFANKTVKIAAVLIAFVKDKDSYKVILTQRSNFTPTHGGQVALPGGIKDINDRDLTQTALREAKEEVNLCPKSIEIIGKLPVHRGGQGYLVTPIIGITNQCNDFKVCEREVEKIFFVPLEYLLDINNFHIRKYKFSNKFYNMPELNYRNYQDRNYQDRNYQDRNYQDRNYKIWGLTAAILWNLSIFLNSNVINNNVINNNVINNNVIR